MNIVKKQELLDNIRRIIGNKKFTFSEAYIKQCGSTPTIGVYERNYNAITKKYLFIDCWGRYDYSVEKSEGGWYFMRYPICYTVGSGQIIHKVELEDMFTEDLQKLYNDIVFYLWWETNVNLPKLKKAYEECLKYKPMFDKLKISSEELEKITNQ
jgi:hypothetical protein